MTKEKLIEIEDLFSKIRLTEKLISEFEKTPPVIFIQRVFDLTYGDIDERINEFASSLKADLQRKVSSLNKTFESL